MTMIIILSQSAQKISGKYVMKNYWTVIRVHFCTDNRINFVRRYNHESATMRQPNNLQKHFTGDNGFDRYIKHYIYSCMYMYTYVYRIFYL